MFSPTVNLQKLGTFTLENELLKTRVKSIGNNKVIIQLKDDDETSLGFSVTKHEGRTNYLAFLYGCEERINPKIGIGVLDINARFFDHGYLSFQESHNSEDLIQAIIEGNPSSLSVIINYDDQSQFRGTLINNAVQTGTIFNQEHEKLEIMDERPIVGVGKLKYRNGTTYYYYEEFKIENGTSRCSRGRIVTSEEIYDGSLIKNFPDEGTILDCFGQYFVGDFFTENNKYNYKKL